ncbi:MAG: peptide deformylase [Myxococcales bacterium]|nr:peptide deformylase [Myxococcales bacterium]
MALLKIAQVGHPVLRECARPVTRDELATPELQRFVDDLVETMRDAGGAGLAASQVYRPIRLCVLELRAPHSFRPEWPLTVLANPVVKALGEERFDNYEGCLSVPELRARVPRWAHIRVRGWNRDGSDFEREIRGITAGTFQHEVDHLDGTLYLDRVTETQSICTAQNFVRYREQEYVARAREIVARHGS